MKIMIISDLHYDKRIFHGIDESRAWEWLLDIVDYHKPDLLLGCGDWGIAKSSLNTWPTNDLDCTTPALLSNPSTTATNC